MLHGWSGRLQIFGYFSLLKMNKKHCFVLICYPTELAFYHKGTSQLLRLSLLIRSVYQTQTMLSELITSEMSHKECSKFYQQNV